MRASSFVMLVAACVCTNSDLEKLESVVGRLKPHMKGERAHKMEMLVNRIQEDLKNMPKLRNELGKCDGALQKKILFSPEQKEFLENLSNRKLNKAPRSKGSIEDVNSKSGIADELFQGDMLLSKEQQEEIIHDNESRAKRQAYNDTTYPGRRWPTVVNYTLDNSLDNKTKEAFKNATYLWMDDTCIDFMEDETEEAEDIILVYKDIGCWAEVGRHGGWQLISLGDGCETVSTPKSFDDVMVGIAAHEIGHALGFSHTHTRHDRDQFITVIEENVNCTWLRQFEAKTTDTNNNYNLTYDYGSLMQYGASSFVNESLGTGKLTMIPKDVLYTETLGSPFISFYDLLMMNTYYNCTGKCVSYKCKDGDAGRNCSNGGFAHPRNCSKCICPSGYGGQFCDQRPPGCGAVLNATQNWTTLENHLNRTEAGKDGFMKCNYWIEAPENHTIEVKIVELPGEFYYEGCTNAGVEIKTHSDQRRTGYRFCSANAVNTTLRSNSSIVPVITFKRERFDEELQGADGDYYEYESSEDGEDDDNEDGEDSEKDEEKEENKGISVAEKHLGTIVKLEYRYV